MATLLAVLSGGVVYGGVAGAHTVFDSQDDEISRYVGAEVTIQVRTYNLT